MLEYKGGPIAGGAESKGTPVVPLVFSEKWVRLVSLIDDVNPEISVTLDEPW